MNKNELWAMIKRHGDTQGELAESLGISRATLSKKMNEKGNSSFTQPEIAHIKERYKLSAEDISNIFFA